MRRQAWVNGAGLQPTLSDSVEASSSRHFRGISGSLRPYFQLFNNVPCFPCFLIACFLIQSKSFTSRNPTSSPLWLWSQILYRPRFIGQIRCTKLKPPVARQDVALPEPEARSPIAHQPVLVVESAKLLQCPDQFRYGLEVPGPQQLPPLSVLKKRSIQPLPSGSRTNAGEDSIPRKRARSGSHHS